MEEAKKDMGTVQRFQASTEEKFSLGMAINNAAVLFAPEFKEYGMDKGIEQVEILAQKLYEMNLRLRKKNLGI